MHDIIQKIRERYERIKNIRGGSIVLTEREAKALLKEMDAMSNETTRRYEHD